VDHKFKPYSSRCFVSTKSRIAGGMKLNLKYDNRKYNEQNDILKKLGNDLIKVIKVRFLNIY